MKRCFVFTACSWLLLAVVPLLYSGETSQLRESFQPGYQYHVSTRVELSGNMTLPAEQGQPARPLSITGTSAIEYDERVAAVVSGAVEKTLRIYRRVDLQRNVGGRQQQSSLRPNVRRLVLLRLGNAEVPFSPDGPLAWGEIDLVRTDVFTPALAGLMPRERVSVGARWPAEKAAVQELTDFERIEDGSLSCSMHEVSTHNNRRLARIAFAGTVTGINEDGPSRQQLEGYCLFDLESQHLSYLSLKGTHILLGKDGKESGRIEGRFVLTRQANVQCDDLADKAVQGIDLTPNDRNTLLLYDNPDLGIQFLHPRRWKVAGVRGRQITLDEANGSGLLLTVEPRDRVPSQAQFLAESRTFLQREKAAIVQEEAPRQLQKTPRELDRFAFDSQLAGSRVWLDYYVARQALGGATLAARLLPADLSKLRSEVEGMAHSLVIAKPPPALRE